MTRALGLAQLFTSARYDGLPGRSFPGDPRHYPGRDEVVSYRTGSARDFELPVQLGSRVRSISRADDGYFIELDDRRYESEQIVVATGPFQTPRTPMFAERLGPEIVQLHSSAYGRRKPSRKAQCSLSKEGTPGFRSRRSPRARARTTWRSDPTPDSASAAHVRS